MKALVAVYCNVAPPKEAQRCKVARMSNGVVSASFVVDNEVVHKSSLGISVFACHCPGAVQDEFDEIFLVKGLVLHLFAVAKNNPPRKPVRSTKLLDL